MLRIAVVLLAISVALPALAQQPQPPAAAPAKPAPKKSPQPKGTPAGPVAQVSGPCVGIVSGAAEAFAVKKIGFTVFGNEYKAIPAADFKLDDVIVERVQATVGRGFVARKLAYAKGAFDSYSAGGLGFGNAEAAALVEKAVGSARCARYVIVTPAVAQFTGNQNIAGIGIVHSGVGPLSHSQVHAVVRIIVHDGRTYEVLKSGIGSTSGFGVLAGAPSRVLKDFKWPEAPEAVNTPEVRAAARSLLAEVLDKSLPNLLGP
jgi:hypothetical protein